MARVTIEDSLKQARNRFGLVLLTLQRTHQLLKGAKPFSENNNREIVTALREIASGKVRYAHPEYFDPEHMRIGYKKSVLKPGPKEDENKTE